MMNKLLIFSGMTMGSYAGWSLGSDWGMIGAFIASGIGSMLGIYLGWRINRDYLE